MLLTLRHAFKKSLESPFRISQILQDNSLLSVANFKWPTAG